MKVNQTRLSYYANECKSCDVRSICLQYYDCDFCPAKDASSDGICYCNEKVKLHFSKHYGCPLKKSIDGVKGALENESKRV